MVKKEYLKPEMDVMEITVESMIATSTSPEIIPGGGTGEGGDGDFSNDRRGGWGDLWN